MVADLLARARQGTRGSGSSRQGLDRLSAVFAVGATLLAWQVLSRATASLLYDNGQYGSALVFRPSGSQTLTDIAKLAITGRPGTAGDARKEDARKDDARKAASLAARALRSIPVNTVALRILAQAAEVLGDGARADRLMTLASAQSLRDDSVDLYRTVVLASAGKFRESLYYADALMRVDPGRVDAYYPILDRIAAIPLSHSAFVSTLGSAPFWRSGFLASVASTIPDPSGFDDVVLRLRTASQPLTDPELKAYLDALIRRSAIEPAYYLWLSTLPPDRLSTVGNLYNGRFAYRPTGLPFDWQVTPIEGATVAFASSTDKAGVSISFDGRRTPFNNLVQLMVLPPGRYRLQGEAEANELRNPRGMTWRVYCASSGNAQMIAETPFVAGSTGGWRPFEASFAVPPQDCPAQWVHLELASRVAAEETVSGTIAFNGLHVDKIADQGGGSTAAPDRSGRSR